jgi:hypothetical protein
MKQFDAKSGDVESSGPSASGVGTSASRRARQAKQLSVQVRNDDYRIATTEHDEEKTMKTRIGLFALALALLVSGGAAAQSPLLDMMASNVTQKYQQATCEQLWEARGKPKSPQEQELITLLRSDPQMRATFIDKIAAPVANKMFDCGLIP